MTQIIQNNLPDTARVWVYQSTRKLSPSEVILAERELFSFIEDWTSHKLDVKGNGHLLYNRFVILIADEEQVKLGGCSIDSSVRFIKSIEQKFNTSFFDRLNIAYKKGNEVYSCDSCEFENLIKKGEVHDETIVFNNLVQTKQELITKWEIPYKESWHKNLALANTPFSSIL